MVCVLGNHPEVGYGGSIAGLTQGHGNPGFSSVPHSATPPYLGGQTHSILHYYDDTSHSSHTNTDLHIYLHESNFKFHELIFLKQFVFVVSNKYRMKALSMRHIAKYIDVMYLNVKQTIMELYVFLITIDFSTSLIQTPTLSQTKMGICQGASFGFTAPEPAPLTINFKM